MLRSIGKQSRESGESVLKKKRRQRWAGFAEKEGFWVWNIRMGGYG